MPKLRNGVHYSPVLNYINERPWAILPETLDLIHTVIGRRVYEGKLTEVQIDLALEGSERRPDDPYIVNGTMVIPIYGTITKKMNLFSRMSGGASTEIIQSHIREGLENPDVENILLDIDSPGGSTDGPFELADFIYESRGDKKIVAFANGLMASAAYLIGSAADEVYSTQAAQVGSIGVILAHYDYSKRYEDFGVKKTYLYSGKYKAVGNDAAPLSEKDRAYIQAHLDQLYTMFVDVVAKNRGVTVETALNEMAEARIFIGEKANEAGLTDGVATFESLLNPNKIGGGILWEVAAEQNADGISTYNDTTTVSYDSESVGDLPLTETEKEVNTDMAEKVVITSLSDLKKADPDGYKALLGEAVAMAKDDLKLEHQQELAAQKGKFEVIVGELQTQMNDLAKKDIIRQEKLVKTTAANIANDTLNESDIPVHLHDKVSGMVSYTKFMKDDELDEEGYQAALDAEIEDWYKKGIRQQVLGSGAVFKSPDGKDELQANEAETTDWVANMVTLAGQELPEGYGTA